MFPGLAVKCSCFWGETWQVFHSCVVKHRSQMIKTQKPWSNPEADVPAAGAGRWFLPPVEIPYFLTYNLHHFLLSLPPPLPPQLLEMEVHIICKKYGKSSFDERRKTCMQEAVSWANLAPSLLLLSCFLKEIFFFLHSAFLMLRNVVH